MNLYESNDTYTVETYKDHDDWLKHRGAGVGGSDASCFVNVNPWKSLNDLWHDKKFGAEKITSDAIEYGTNAEPHIRELFKLKHPELDVQYEENVTLVSKKNPIMRYSPDGLIYDKANGTKGILEIKTTKIMQSSMLQKWGTKASPEVPDNYFVQTLHGLNVTGFDFVIFCAEIRFLDNESKIIERSFNRKEVLQDLEMVNESIEKGWEEYFVADKEPPISIRL